MRPLISQRDSERPAYGSIKDIKGLPVIRVQWSESKNIRFIAARLYSSLLNKKIAITRLKISSPNLPKIVNSLRDDDLYIEFVIYGIALFETLTQKGGHQQKIIFSKPHLTRNNGVKLSRNCHGVKCTNMLILCNCQ